MHELTIAKNILAIVEDELKKRDQLDCQVREIYFNTGRLNAVVPQSLQSNFEQIKKQKQFLQNATLIIQEIPVTIKCRDCQEQTEIDEPIFRCQACDSVNIEVIAGKRMYIESMEIEEK